MGRPPSGAAVGEAESTGQEAGTADRLAIPFLRPQRDLGGEGDTSDWRALREKKAAPAASQLVADPAEEHAVVSIEVAGQELGKGPCDEYGARSDDVDRPG